jgi:hypothetical protein
MLRGKVADVQSRDSMYNHLLWALRLGCLHPRSQGLQVGLQPDRGTKKLHSHLL